jgi:hypothetical protein
MASGVTCLVIYGVYAESGELSGRIPLFVPRCLFRLVSYNKYVVIKNACDLLSARMLPKSSVSSAVCFWPLKRAVSTKWRRVPIAMISEAV